MNSLLSAINAYDVIDWWAITLLHSLWIITGIALATNGLLAVVQTTNAELRSKIALGGMVFAFVSSISIASCSLSTGSTPPMLPSTTVSTEKMTSISDATNANESLASLNTTNDFLLDKPQRISSVFSWRFTIVGVWLLGATFMLFRLGYSHICAKRLVWNANAEVPEWLNVLLNEAMEGVDLLRNVSVRIGDQIPGPMVYGILEPIVLLPTSLITGVSYDSIRVILAHELAHIRRGDLLLGVVQRLIESLFFYHPAIWWLSRLVDREREAACDTIAVGLVGKRLTVATALVDSAEHLSSHVPTAALAAGGGSLPDRIARLVAPSQRPRFRVPWSTFVLLSLLGLIGLISLSAGTSLVAVEVAKALSPSEQVKVIEAAIEKNISSDDSEATCTITGRLVAPDGGKLSGWPNVMLWTKNGTSSISTGGDGRFKGGVKGSTLYKVSADASSYASTDFGPYKLKSDNLDLGDLRLEIGFQAKIKVENEEGEPLTGVQVESLRKWLEIQPGDRSFHSIRVDKELRSNVDGVIELEHLPKQALEVSLLKDGYEQAKREITFEEGAIVKWKLVRAAPLVGRFVDGAGAGIPNVELHYAKRDNSIADRRNSFLQHLVDEKIHSQPIATSNANGDFQIESLRSNSKYTLMVLHADCRPKLLSDVTAGQQLETITLDPPLIVRGQIKGDLTKLQKRSGSYILHYRNPPFPLNYSDSFDTKVDPEGHFEITQLFPGVVRLYAADQLLPLHQFQDSIEGIVFDLDKASQTLVDNVRNFKVTLKPTAKQPVRGKVQLSWSLAEAPPYGSQQSNKFITLTSNTIESQAPIGARISIHGRELVGSRIKTENQILGILPEGEGPHVFEVPLDPAGLLSEQVLDHDGTPIKAYRIDVDRMTGKNSHFEIHATSVTHPMGASTLGPLPIGDQHSYQAYVQVKGTWRIALGDTFNVNEAKPVHKQMVQLPPPVYLSGRVLDANGSPASGAALQMTLSYTRPQVNSRTSRGTGAWQKTDAEGRFRVAISSPAKNVDGKYSIDVRPFQNSTGHTLSFSTSQFYKDHDFGDIKLKLGGTLNGTVIGKDGKPRSKVRLSLMPLDFENADYKEHHSIETNHKGEFSVNGLEQVPLRLDAYGTELLKASSPISIRRDRLGNSRWVLDPIKEKADVKITVE